MLKVVRLGLFPHIHVQTELLYTPSPLPMKCKGIHASMFVHVNNGAQVCACANMDYMMVFICHTEVREVCYLSERLEGLCYKDAFLNAEYSLFYGPPQILITA